MINSFNDVNHNEKAHSSFSLVNIDQLEQQSCNTHKSLPFHDRKNSRCHLLQTKCMVFINCQVYNTENYDTLLLDNYDCSSMLY